MYNANLVFWDCKSMGIRSCSTPSHSERSKVGYPEGFGDMETTHRTGTLNEDVSALTGFPRCLE